MDLYNISKVMINDHLAFQHTDKFAEWGHAGAHPHQARWVRLGGRRTLGFTTAACRLLVDFRPSILIVPSNRHVDHTINTLAYDFDRVVANRDDMFMGVLVRDLIIPFSSAEMFFQNRKGPVLSANRKYVLAIIDEAGSIENRRELERLRDQLFIDCELVVEFQ